VRFPGGTLTWSRFFPPSLSPIGGLRRPSAFFHRGVRSGDCRRYLLRRRVKRSTPLYEVQVRFDLGFSSQPSLPLSHRTAPALPKRFRLSGPFSPLLTRFIEVNFNFTGDPSRVHLSAARPVPERIAWPGFCASLTPHTHTLFYSPGSVRMGFPHRRILQPSFCVWASNATCS